MKYTYAQDRESPVPGIQIPIFSISISRLQRALTKGVTGPHHETRLGSLGLPLLPHEDKREQDRVNSMLDDFRYLQTHVARFPEEEAPSPAMGSSDLGDIIIGPKLAKEWE